MPNPIQIKTKRRTYVREKSASIARWLREPVPPTLVFSDTHFVPRWSAWSDDAPEDLLALLEQLSTHRLLSLGDLTESVGLAANERGELFTSERLQPLWSLLRARDARVLIGNHDVSAAAQIRAHFNDVTPEYFPGDIRLRHGHERERVMTEVVRLVGPIAVPIYERAFRRSGRGPERLPNARVLSAMPHDDAFVFFGHTHARGMELKGAHGAWANPGCFLGSAQSFIMVEETEIALYTG
jgi:hypothetical protein